MMMMTAVRKMDPLDARRSPLNFLFPPLEKIVFSARSSRSASRSPHCSAWLWAGLPATRTGGRFLVFLHHATIPNHLNSTISSKANRTISPGQKCSSTLNRLLNPLSPHVTTPTNAASGQSRGETQGIGL